MRYASPYTERSCHPPPLGISGSPKLMETNRESSAARAPVRRRAYNVNDIYYGALRNYAINTRSFESAKNCSLRDARYC